MPLRLGAFESGVIVCSQSAERAKVIVRGAAGRRFPAICVPAAGELGLNGWVLNPRAACLLRLKAKERRSADFSFVSKRKSRRARHPQSEFAILDPAGYKGFEIRYSDESGAKSVLILPDIATCPKCLRETFDP
jgi:hydrogenase maturation protein HypF